jgi:hypothetical protein
MKKALVLKKPLLLICCWLLCFLGFSQVLPLTSANTTLSNPDVSTNGNLTYKIINTSSHTYGYDVYRNGKLFIHQPSIPALSGNDGFKTKQDAEKVAGLVINKIKKGEMPPTITIADLREQKNH